jgi:hypothetical protein
LILLDNLYFSAKNIAQNSQRQNSQMGTLVGLGNDRGGLIYR